MSDFVNYQKRGVQLPPGCKDLIDVLQRPDSKHETDDNAVSRFIHLILFQAQQDEATELVIGAAPAKGDVPILYKVADAWREMSPLPSHARRDVITELTRMAQLPVGQFPIAGILDVTFANVRLHWIVGMAGADAECMLVRLD